LAQGLLFVFSDRPGSSRRCDGAVDAGIGNPPNRAAGVVAYEQRAILGDGERVILAQASLTVGKVVF
jgi:hypothetical protein